MRIDQPQLGGPRQIHTVRGGNGVRLHVGEWGQPDGPAILLIHGWSQGLTCWRHQVEGELAAECRLVALDIRGHGMSERPRSADSYQDANLWAMDIAAVLDQLNLHRPILVGWSYGGFIISDYLRAFGQDTIAAINYVGAATLLNEAFRPHRARVPGQRSRCLRPRPHGQHRGHPPPATCLHPGANGRRRLGLRPSHKHDRAARGPCCPTRTADQLRRCARRPNRSSTGHPRHT